MVTAWILLPALNEESGIRETIRSIPTDAVKKLGFDCRVLVVDGRSTDSTVEISREEGAEILIQNGPRGKGAGVREAFSFFQNNAENGDLVCMMDADGTYPTSLLPEIFGLLSECDVVMGSRLRGRISKGSMSKINYLGNSFLSIFASLVNLKRTTDVCTGIWGFRHEILPSITPISNGFSVEAEMFSRACRNKLILKEIPANYSNRNGHSHLIWYRDGPQIFLSLLKLRFQKIRM